MSPPLCLLQPGEELQPEEEEAQQGTAAAAATPAAAPQPDDTIVAQLVSMGFSENGSKRAALAVSNAGWEGSGGEERSGEGRGVAGRKFL